MLPVKRLISVLWLPGLIYLCYATARLNGIQGETDLVGISAVMRIVFLSFGASVAYMMTIVAQWEPFRTSIRTRFWTHFACWSLAMIVDDAFMIHEQVGVYLQIPDSLPMLPLGVWLVILLGTYRDRFVPVFWRCFAGFVILACIAMLGDILTGKEGTVMIGSFDFDYEMFSEVLAVTILSGGVAIQAASELRTAARPDTESYDATH